MEIEKKSILLLNNLYLHDMELLDIKVHYDRHLVEIELLGDADKHIMSFEDMQYFAITACEPWGEGKYVNEVKSSLSTESGTIKYNDYNIHDSSFMTDILLNSGDRISILSSKITFI